jgi:tetratricopeptide (TPR) repeat protein
MSGKQTHLAVLADCERALGRPEKAIDLYRTPTGRSWAPRRSSSCSSSPPARGPTSARSTRPSRCCRSGSSRRRRGPWAARLRYAYADALLRADRRDEAREWFARAAEIDEDLVTDAAERLLELDGIVLEDDEDDDLDSDADVVDVDAADQAAEVAETAEVAELDEVDEVAEVD